MKDTMDNQIGESFEFRPICWEEAKQAVEIEQICFPPNEACAPERIKERIKTAPELFLAAVDKRTGKVAGFLNGLSTDETAFRDEFFLDITLYYPRGKTIMILGLDVLPEYRGQGLARELVLRYLNRARDNNRELVILTCHEEKIKMYEKMGFVNQGISASVWGGEEWYEMSCRL